MRHEPSACGRCGAGLVGRPVTSVERRQVFGLPPMQVEVTEHQLIERECARGHRTKAAAPGGADAPVQYGPRIAAIIIYLHIGQFLSKKRTAQALAELFGVPVSSGTVAAVTGRAAGRLSGFLEQARAEIAANAEHQLCRAHVLQELQAVAGAAPAGQWCWATQAAEAITAMQHLVTVAISQGHQRVDRAALAGQLTRYRSAALIGPRPRTSPDRAAPLGAHR